MGSGKTGEARVRETEIEGEIEGGSRMLGLCLMRQRRPDEKHA